MLYKPIFIIAQHRTGSTFLKNILNMNSKVAMATDEMHLFIPFGNSFGKQFYKFGDYNKVENIDKLIDFFFNENIRGTFWQEYTELGISKDTLKNSFLNTQRFLKDFISVLLDEYRKLEKKERIGAKYPLHFSKTSVLKEWFPDSKIILLHRDIKAVCASKLNDDATKKRKKKFGFIAHYLTLFAFIFEYIWLSLFYKKNKELFYLIDYSEMISRPNIVLPELCDFCEIENEPDMYKAFGKASSHTGKVEKGFDASRVEKWKKVLNKFDVWLITSLTNKSRKRFFYESNINT